METALFVIFAGIGLIVAYFLFRKKPAVVVDDTVAKSYRQILQTQVEYYQNLDADGKTRFETLVNKFIGDVNIEGVGGDITDTDRILVAASAVIPIFGFPDWEYRNLTNVIVYPDTFDNDFQFEGGSRNIMGMVGTGYMNGQMLLSRQALVRGFAKNNGKENTAIHEFVHLLDKTDGATDGIPENLMARQYVLPWLQMMHREMQRIRENKSDINPYALTNEAEFLAVVSEYFFEKPDQFQHKHPELYEQLSMIFKQDPAGEVA